MWQENFEAQFQLLFTLAHLPGVFLPFFTGSIVDRIGARLCLLILTLLCFIGQVTSSIGVQKESWPITLTGRFIYGLGFESLFVANQAFLETRFHERGRLGMALGLSSAASYIGYLLSFIISPIAAIQVNVAFSFWLGAIVKGVSVLASVAIYILCRDEHGKMVLNRKTRNRADQVDCIEANTGSEGNQLSLARETNSNTSCWRLGLEYMQNFNLSFWLLCTSCLLVYSTSVPLIQMASGLLLERNLFLEPPNDCVLKHPDECSSGYLVPSGGNPATDANGAICPTTTNFAPPTPTSLHITDSDPSWEKSSYVHTHLSTLDIDCTDAFWSEACTRNYCDKQETVTQQAGILMAIPFIVTVATTFVFGHFGVDRAGLRAEMVTGAPVLLVTAHAIILFRRGSPVVPLILLGLGFSMAVSELWPSVSFAVKDSVVGAAFGLMTCIQNIGLTLFPIMISAIYNCAGHHYLPSVEIFLLACSALGVVVGSALYCWDKRHGRKLRGGLAGTCDEQGRRSSCAMNKTRSLANGSSKQ
jgi:MFS family permease